MDGDLDTLMRGKATDELKAMVEVSPHDWSPDALRAACAELRARGVAYVERDPEQTDAEARSRPLSAGQRGALLAGGLLLLIGVLKVLVYGFSVSGLLAFASGAALVSYGLTRR